MAATGFRLDSLRQFNDKPGERDFANLAVFRQNDPDSVQRRARAAMHRLNGLLLLALAIALERVFSAGVSLGTLLFLAIDPTVAAHLPVVMTDLPVALLSATAVVLAARAFCEWRWADLAVCSALQASADRETFCTRGDVGLSPVGAWLAIVQPRESPEHSSWHKGLKLCAVLGGAMFVLWASYLFRYSNSNWQRVVNRPLVEKIKPHFFAPLSRRTSCYGYNSRGAARLPLGFCGHHPCGY